MWINHINATNVTMYSHGRIVLRYIPEHTLGINHFNVVNLIRHSHKRDILCDIQGHTLEINHFTKNKLYCVCDFDFF